MLEYTEIEIVLVILLSQQTEQSINTRGTADLEGNTKMASSLPGKQQICLNSKV